VQVERLGVYLEERYLLSARIGRVTRNFGMTATMLELDLSPQCLLSAYVSAIFPMADDDGTLHWLSPDPRAIIELDDFQTTRSLRATIRRGVYEVCINRAFDAVIDACADRPSGTWISPEIRDAYVRLHELGFAHSVEAWRDDRLVGGLYGVAIGGAYFGESMFHHETDASKVTLVALVERMKQRGLSLLDVQFVTDHLARFGAVEISRADYVRRLHQAVQTPCVFDDDVGPTSVRLDAKDQ
jgi:leucyl/phenylalanyl-tRNA---protein transferase